MASAAPAQAISHQNVRLGPGRHPRPGKIVCVMELASMLAGDRFGDRPVSVCPVIGAILRAYNDNVDDRRRQDLYRFAADAVDTRRDYRVQRHRADAALDWAQARYASRSAATPAAPDPEGRRDEIGYYVVGSLAEGRSRRSRWSDEEHGAMIALLEDLIEMDREPAPVSGPLVAQPELEGLIEEPLVREATFDLIIGEPSLGEDTPLIGHLLEQIAQPLEHGGGHHEFVFAERLQCRAEARLEASTALLDQSAPAVGERGEHDAPVAVGTLTANEAGRREPFQHLGHARRAQVGGVREVAHRHLTLVAKAEQQAVLRVGELARAAGLAPAQPAHRGHRALERSSHLLGGVALLALAYHVAKRR
jgi:hypothetical protein